MQIDRARFLVSPTGREALANHAGVDAGDPVRLAAVLRRDLPPADASAVAEQLTLRERAYSRTRLDPQLLLTHEGLEMMTHPLVAERRSARLARYGLALDLTCGIGGDLRYLAAAGPAAGLERDPATALLAAANVPGAQVARGDAARPPFDLSHAAVLVDPSRRSEVRRTFDPGAFSPPWETALSLARSGIAGVVKGPPGLPASAVPPDAEVEFVQLGRSMREAALWFGGDAEPGLRRAVQVRTGDELTSRDPEADGQPVAPGAFLFDPESCVTLAGLVRHLAFHLDARLIDQHIAYITADSPAFHPLAAAFEVLERVDFSVQRLKSVLRANSWRPDDIRRRGFPVEPDELRKLLGRFSGSSVTLLCTTIDGARTVFVARPLLPPEAIAQPGRQ